jgi:hypothetical protein
MIHLLTLKQSSAENSLRAGIYGCSKCRVPLLEQWDFTVVLLLRLAVKMERMTWLHRKILGMMVAD